MVPPAPPPGLISDAEIRSAFSQAHRLASEGPQRTHQYIASRLVGSGAGLARNRRVQSTVLQHTIKPHMETTACVQGLCS